MIMYEAENIPEKLEEFHWQACGWECPVLTGGKCRKDSGKWCTSPKFDSAAAESLFMWSLEFGSDEESGTSDYGNGWHGLFREERAIVSVDSQGFVSAWRIPGPEDLEAAWEEIQSGAVYPDDECGNGSSSCSEDDLCGLCADDVLQGEDVSRTG